MLGLEVGGKTQNDLRYEDGTVVIAENKKDIQNLLTFVKNQSRKKGPNFGKMAIRKNTTPD